MLLRKPIISLLITVALLVFMTGGAAELRPTAESGPSVWLIAVALLLIVDGVVRVLIILPRSLTTESEAKSLIQWAGAIAIYLVAWVSWFLFGVPSRILVVGAAATVVFCSRS